MNVLALIAGVLALFACLIHAAVGGRELNHIAAAAPTAKAAEVRLQVINAWHWVSADLLLSGIAFVLIAVTDLIRDERTVLGVLSVYFLVAGCVWLVTTAITSRARPMMMLRLGQWILCFLLSALAYTAR